MTLLPKYSPLNPATHGPLWRLGRIAVCWSVGMASKLFLNTLPGLKVDGLDKLHKLILERPPGVPLITVANHASTIDDPVLWGLLQQRCFVSRNDDLRWTTGAQEICYKNLPLSLFFVSGKTIPIMRGRGVYQPAMDFAVAKLDEGRWVHIFPEGKVHQEDTMLPFKWGVGRLIMDAKVAPIVVPIYHRGFAKIHPLEGGKLGGWLPSPFHSLEVTIGDPVDTAPWRALGETPSFADHAPAAEGEPPSAALATPSTHRAWITEQIRLKMLALETRKLGHPPRMLRGDEVSDKS
ncbi:Lyso-phosphatidylcholine acyltransferase [Blastocladiella emersonii ATCC 22665]|nr:Lyso-phosphatidylcholine acyltransferase [Blastocladiella emersonii ATCC 22665]